ncbi:hypothetical protein WAF17_13575 [Bernardetia sp. ABR2-2B]|uniref:hypothetical protein n=1 Tax=Bernardetia sp. ABR2-2B TaxID=3127472 RepID=UPI0030D306CA
MTNTHRLEKELHSEFLEQGRIDPITGELIEEGHTIVICAACKSAFFIESWEYLGEEHCNQTDTLTDIPKPKNLFLESKPLEYLPFLFRKGVYFAKDGSAGTLEMLKLLVYTSSSLLGLGIFTVLIGYFISVILAGLVCFGLVILIAIKMDEKQEEAKHGISSNPKKDTYIAIDSKNQSLKIKRNKKQQSLPFKKVRQIEYSLVYMQPNYILTLEITSISMRENTIKYHTSINNDEIIKWSNFLEELPYNLKVLQITK